MITAAPLPSRLAVGALSVASVRAVCLAAKLPHVDSKQIDPERVALAFRSDRVLRIRGAAPDVWSELSRFWQVDDGWIRTHGNYPHHARALRSALELPDDADAAALSATLAGRSAEEAAHTISSAGGLAVAVRHEDHEVDAALRARPVVETTRLGEHKPSNSGRPGRPLDGIRVLDLTRVIAGPVCTRTLALLGADVLRIDSPALPEPQWQHLDTGHGKRSAVLDARSDRFAELLDAADVIVLGYRPRSLERLGLSPALLAERSPGLIVAQLSAWGDDQPERAGFDSLVQAESGIALIETPDGLRPGALPAQALDHSAGYLLAAGILEALSRRRFEGGTFSVSTSLRRVAAELLSMPRRREPGSERDIDAALHTQRFTIDGVDLTTVRSALPGVEFRAPRPWGRDEAAW